MNTKWLNNIGRIIKKKDGGFFMVFERQLDKNKVPRGENPFPLTINEGDFFQLKAKSEDLRNLVESGKMTQETADAICENVRFEISRAPDREGSSAPAPAAAAPATATKKSKDEVNF